MTQTPYTDNLKMSLLKPLNTAQECELLGGRYFIRRLSALALLEQEEKATQAFEAGDMRQASLLNVQMLLDCLCDPEGQPIPPEALPTADALMAAHDNGTLLDAIATVKRHAVGSLEDAQKN